MTIGEQDKSAIISTFLRTRDSSKVVVFQALNDLQPNKIGNAAVLVLADYVRQEASSYLRSANLPKHSCIFGTGGDGSHTINISTIASIVAAHYHISRDKETAESVIKLGTNAVTGRHGAAQAIKGLESLYPKGSKFVGLGEMGFPYSDSLISARKDVARKGMLDIYKVIFPGSNLSNSEKPVTGYSRVEYLGFLKLIAAEYSPNSVFLTSSDGNDEIMTGKNSLEQKGVNHEVVVKVDDDKETQTFLAERVSREEQKQSIIDVLTANCPEGALRVIAFNAALLTATNISKIENEADKIHDFLHSQRRCRTIVPTEIMQHGIK